MAERIAIIDYGSGNLRSVEKAFERAAREAGAAVAFSVTDDPEIIRAADRVVLPGVGAFGACIAGLKARGVMEALEYSALAKARPFLGICVGMQLLAAVGREYGDHDGLGWIPGVVAPLAPVGKQAAPLVRTPHMGWNEIKVRAAHPVLRGVDEEAFYFAHSFHFVVENNQNLIATTVHGGEVCAAVARDNIAGLQFHPEKSQRAGLAVLRNFLSWSPA